VKPWTLWEHINGLTYVCSFHPANGILGWRGIAMSGTTGRTVWEFETHAEPMVPHFLGQMALKVVFDAYREH
jgi:hypothetical protein